jgi:hypothetical protein
MDVAGNLVSMSDDQNPSVKVTQLDEDVPHALHQHYAGEQAPQACHLALDLRDGELSAAYNPEIGSGIPAFVYHHVVLWWPIACLTAAAANSLLRDLAPLAQRVLAGSRIEWDGSNDVGVLTRDAQAAEQQILDLIADHAPDLEQVSELDAGDWFSEGDLPAGLSADTTDEELAELAAAEEREVATIEIGRRTRYTVLLNAEEYLTARRDELRESRADEVDSQR